MPCPLTLQILGHIQKIENESGSWMFVDGYGDVYHAINRDEEWKNMALMARACYVTFATAWSCTDPDVWRSSWGRRDFIDDLFEKVLEVNDLGDLIEFRISRLQLTPGDNRLEITRLGYSRRALHHARNAIFAYRAGEYLGGLPLDIATALHELHWTPPQVLRLLLATLEVVDSPNADRKKFELCPKKYKRVWKSA